MREIVEISSGESRCGIAPNLGGSLAFWTVDGQQMLRPLGPVRSPIHSASFPLVPYSNRIAEGIFRFDGKQYHLTAHKLADPHALHGVGWERIWDIEDQYPESLTLVLKHEGDRDWPFAFEARQNIRVEPEGLEINLKAWNKEEFPTPLAIGHHPYFDSQNAQLHFVAKFLFSAAADGIPTDRIAITSGMSFAKGRKVESCEFDNIFSNWSGEAEIHWEDRAYNLRITSDLPHAVVYTPENADFFCFEPVPHINNALNRMDGDMPLVGVGKSFSARIRFSAIRA